jgi:hypothetical protein
VVTITAAFSARSAITWNRNSALANQLIADGAFTIFIINYSSFVQIVTPDEILGRVNSCLMVSDHVAALAGSLIAGVLGTAPGLRAPLYIISRRPTEYCATSRF